MSKFSHLTDTALERVLALAGQAGDGLRSGGTHASDWIKTGATLGAIKTGGRVAGRVVRRNPGTALALAAVGVGLLGYAAYRKRQRAQTTPWPADQQDRPYPVMDDAADVDAQ